MKEIQLTQGKVALVDDEDFDRVNQFKWYAAESRGRVYAGRQANKKTVFMHCFLAGQTGIDHKDGNGLNNQRDNIRLATKSQNQHNRRKLLKGSSVFKGVCWDDKSRAWRSSIRVNQTQVYLGIFECEIDAAHVYDYVARIYFGEFARLNFP